MLSILWEVLIEGFLPRSAKLIRRSKDLQQNIVFVIIRGVNGTDSTRMLTRLQDP